MVKCYQEGDEKHIPDLPTFLEITNNCTSTNFLCGAGERERVDFSVLTTLECTSVTVASLPLPSLPPFSTLSIPRGELESQPTSQNSFIAAQFSAGSDPRPLESRDPFTE